MSKYIAIEINLPPLAFQISATSAVNLFPFGDIISISANDLLAEKLAAYRDRRFVRDIYDIYILSSYIERDEKTVREISDFLNKMPPPINEEDLASLIYDGPVPSLQSMLMQIRGRLS